MESKIISVYDYHNIDLSEYQKQFIPDEAAVQKEISSLQNKYCRWEEGEEICKGDIVSCRLQSELPRFQKENAQIAVGSGLLNRELEDSLVGKRKGEPVCVRAEGADVTVSVEEIRHRIVSDLTDSQIKDLGIDGVQNLEGFKTYLARQQREKFLDEIEYPAIQYVTSEVLRESDVVVKKKDWQQAVQMELEKYRVLAGMEGLKLETMTEAEFEGKIPVRSYHELLAMVQEQNWDTVAECLIGKTYADRKGYQPDQEGYQKFIREYMEFWHNTEEEAKRITSYDYYVFQEYTGCFYKELRSYVRQHILR